MQVMADIICYDYNFVKMFMRGYSTYVHRGVSSGFYLLGGRGGRAAKSSKIPNHV